MSKSPKPPLDRLDEYWEVLPLLRHVRVMERFFREVIDNNPAYLEHYAPLHVAYMEILNGELAPHALTFALAITELQDAFPTIPRTSKG